MSRKGGLIILSLLKPEIDRGIEIEFIASGRGLFGFSSCSLSATVNASCSNSALTAQNITESLCAANAILVLIYCHN